MQEKYALSSITESSIPLRALTKRLFRINAYEEDILDGTVISEGFRDFLYLLSLKGLAAGGAVITSGKKIVGYSLFYPIENEERPGLPQFYSRCRARVNDWKEISKFTRRHLDTERLWHLYDYCVLPRAQGKGLGKSLLSHAMREIPAGSAMVGFVDSRPRNSHAYSLLLSAKCGALIGPQVSQSFDGPHPSQLLFYRSDTRPIFGRKIIDYRKAITLIDSLSPLLEEHVAKGMLGYNPKSRSLERVIGITDKSLSTSP